MVIPTYYQGEGFPGTILDSYIFGVPVIVSKCKYNSEMIKEGKTGKLFIFNKSKENTQITTCLI